MRAHVLRLMRERGWTDRDVATRLRLGVDLVRRWLSGERIWITREPMGSLAIMVDRPLAECEQNQRAEFARMSLGPCCPSCGSELLDRVEMGPLYAGRSVFDCRGCDWRGYGAELVTRPGPLVMRPRG